ncbi:cold shock domain-containing protein [Acinetobacter thermotolerans]|uniref:cold shock domain-containing protein n=1 Tax=Acinetobacter thermotolerans TaxID=3151487 RepID=UPI00325BD362
MKSEQYQGKVKQYNPEKGFGFIACPEGDVFFHISDFPADGNEPKRNDRVKFNVVENGDRYKAIKIERMADKSKKAKKAKVVAVNTSITSALLSNLKR